MVLNPPTPYASPRLYLPVMSPGSDDVVALIDSNGRMPL